MARSFFEDDCSFLKWRTQIGEGMDKERLKNFVFIVDSDLDSSSLFPKVRIAYWHDQNDWPHELKHQMFPLLPEAFFCFQFEHFVQNVQAVIQFQFFMDVLENFDFKIISLFFGHSLKFILIYRNINWKLHLIICCQALYWRTIKLYVLKNQLFIDEFWWALLVLWNQLEF
jgi:hypothetical protein